MGLLDFLGFSSSDDESEVDSVSVGRLETLSEHAVEAVLVPEETIPIEEDAWTLAPSPARARVGASGLEPAAVESKPSPAPTTIDTKAIEQRLDDRFDRIEATMSIMDARLTQLHMTDNIHHALPTDTLVTASGEEPNQDNDEESDSSDSAAEEPTVQTADRKSVV